MMDDMNDMGRQDFVNLINQWGVDRNITAEGGATVMAQMSKMMEEFAEFLVTYNQLEEVCAAHDCTLEDLRLVLEQYNGTADTSEGWELLHKLEDDFGDILVCLIQAIRLARTKPEACLAKAWKDIRHRKGSMINGKFVKES